MRRGNKNKLIQLNQSDSKEFRKKHWLKQNKQCAILKQPIDLKDCTVDHKHKLKAQRAGPNGRGLVRGILHFQANSLEGVIAKKFKRYGLHKFITLPEFLRNMAYYLSDPPIPPKYIHWTEKPKPKKLGKRDYNRIKKYYFQIHPRAKKIPPYPKSGRMTEKWELLLKKANEIHQKGIK